MQKRRAFTTALKDSLEPQIQRVVQVHVRQHRRDDATLRRSTLRPQHFPICVQHSGLQPLLYQPQKRFIINPLRQHAHQPLVRQIVEEAFDVRFH